MREIKLRAYFKGDITISEPLRFDMVHDKEAGETLFVCATDPEITYEPIIVLADEENWIVQQFTGLLDKNKNPIYEGDVLMLDGGAELKPTGEVIFQDAAFRYKAHWLQSGYPELLAYTVFQDAHENGFKDAITVEIIGNIYEHSHLLKKN
jgi:hypothetical protein